MGVKKFGLALVAFSMVVATAACGGSDSGSRARNMFVQGKQQCLADNSSVNDEGLATLLFCYRAATYRVVSADGTKSEPKTVDQTTHQSTYQAVSEMDVVRIESYDASNVQLGLDQVRITTSSCASGGKCKLGDVGPGGGIVTFDAGSKQGWGQYIEMARPGWYDGTTNQEQPSADPQGGWNCPGVDHTLPTDVGAGKQNTDWWLTNCNNSGIPSYRFVDAFNKSQPAPFTDWVLPSHLDMATARRLPAKAYRSMKFANWSYATSSGMYDDWIGVASCGLYMQPEPDPDWYDFPTVGCLIVTFRYPDNQLSVRPVRYFEALGNGASSISIIGEMDIPAPPPPVTEPTPEVGPENIPAPGLMIGSVSMTTRTLNWSWDPDTDADKISTVQMTYVTDGEKSVMVQSPDGAFVSIPLDAFIPGKEYTFTAQRVSKRTAVVVAGTPVKVVPVRKDAEVPPPTDSTPNTSASTPDSVAVPPTKDTTAVLTTEPITNETVANGPPGNDSVPPVTDSTVATPEKSRDCAMAPWVGIQPKGDLTSDDLVTLTVQHPCMGTVKDGEQQSLRITTMTETDSGPRAGASLTEPLDSDATSHTYARHMAPGTHHYLLQYYLDNWDTKVYVRSVETLVTIVVGDSGEREVEPCDFSGVSIEGSVLTFKCGDLGSAQVVTAGSGPYHSVVGTIADDGRSATMDLTGFEPGWSRVFLITNSGPQTRFLNMFVCVSECGIPKSFEKFGAKVVEPDVIVTEPAGCSTSRTEAYLLQVVSPNIFASSDELSLYPGGSIPLGEGTSVLSLRTSDLGDPCDGGGMFNEIADLNRKTVTNDAPVESSAPVLLDPVLVSTGNTEIKAEEIVAAPVKVAPSVTSALMTQEAAQALYDTKVEGLEVSTVEYSFDGGVTWIPVSKTGGSLPVPKKATSVRFRLTNTDGKSATVIHEIERGEPKYVKAEDVPKPTSSGSGVPMYMWVLAALVVLLAAGLVFSRRKPVVQE